MNTLINQHVSNTGSSSVGVATRYELGGPEIESQWGRDFQKTSILALGPTQSPLKQVPALLG